MPSKPLPSRREHPLDEIDRAVSGRLRARARAAIGQALAGQHAGLVAVGQALVLAEHVADLAPADADVAGRHVGVFAEVAVQLGHERLAEAHDLAVASGRSGSKSEPPLPPPIGMPVSAFLKICSKPRNLMMPRLTDGWKRMPPL